MTEKMKEARQKVYEYLMSLSQEEFRKELDNVKDNFWSNAIYYALDPEEYRKDFEKKI